MSHLLKYMKIPVFLKALSWDLHSSITDINLTTGCKLVLYAYDNIIVYKPINKHEDYIKRTLILYKSGLIAAGLFSNLKMVNTLLSPGRGQTL